MSALLNQILGTRLGDQRPETARTRRNIPTIAGRGQARGASAAGASVRGAARGTSGIPGTGAVPGTIGQSAIAQRLARAGGAVSDRRRQGPRVEVAIGRAGPSSRAGGEEFAGARERFDILNAARQIEEQGEVGSSTDSVRAARRRQRARAIGARGRRDTILTSSLGITGEIPGRRRTLLGA